jgi:tetratricopeptide (TPR) repeat protein
MTLLPNWIQSGEGRPLAVVVVTIVAISAAALHPGDRRPRIVRDADALSYRVAEARFSGGFAHRPFRETATHTRMDLIQFGATAAKLRERWQVLRDPSAGRQWGQAQVLAGNSEAAAALLGDVLEQDSGRPDPLRGIQCSRNSSLLTDFSAAMLERRGNARALVLAFEAADRAWRLSGTPAAAWNRALAAERIGSREAAVRAWRDAAARETSPGWKREASEREGWAKRATGPAPESPELFFHERLTARAAAGDSVDDLLPADRLASNTGLTLINMTARDREHLRWALETYANGREWFARDELEQACAAYLTAERALTSIRSPLALLVREQNIRCQCARAQPQCLERIRAFRREVVQVGPYPWLAARAVYAEGQTLYRRGRVYEAGEAFDTALREFRTVGDAASAGLTHSVLGNAYSAAGETEAALDHHLAAVRLRFAYAGDRRRIQLEDAMLFLLRHDYVATAELLLDELSSAPATEGGQVMEAVLRGVIAFRRGSPQSAEQHFRRAHRFADGIDDATLRAEAKRSVVLAETACGVGPTRRRLVDVDAVAAAVEQKELSLWLPRILTERGIAFEAANDPHRAEQDFLRAMSILEQREPRIDQSSLTLGTGAARESAFDRAIRLYLKQRRIAAALAAAQRSISARISSLHARATGVHDMFRVRDGRRSDAAEDIRSVLPAGHVAVAQHLLSDSLVTWVVTHAEVRMVRRNIAADQVIDAARDLHACASRAGCAEGARVERVSDLLLRDWIEGVPRGATLWLQRPVELPAVPFAMLKTRGGEPLLSRNPLTIAPGFAAFVAAQRLDARRDGAVTALFAAAPRPPGLPPLPMTVREVTRAARFYDTPRLEKAVSRRTFLERALPYAVAHFAGHVLVNDEQPLLSALAFQDGLLYMHELDRDTFSNVRLVVLSGCDSGRTPKPAMSLANALLRQGVPSVVYTIWPIDDSIAAEFAISFHREIALGKSRAESLQHAALSIRQRHPDRPSAWAAFQVAGAPGPITTNRTKEHDDGRD